jgi:tRNA A-37 threonylcarbamoyl transferase component Bud32
MDEPLQKSLERYDVLDRIAVGGMAEVFLAKAYGAHGFEKTLAIKRILPDLARDPEFEARFIAEAKVAVRLSHANVVQVFDFGRIGESLFIAMEYVDGLDLAALLRKFKDDGRLVPLPAAFHIAIEIIRALDFAHQHGVVHRDVSPSNILISRAGEVKIGDFGIAVAASPHKASAPGRKRIMGKWRYMSPEQTRGDTLDTRSDLFSAASVLFELFTGEKLFPGDEAEDIIKNIENMPIPRASSLRSGLPSRLDEILAGPLSRKPIDRPNRPTVVLRSLIELSYESSIMATALDVAEAVASVLPPPRAEGAGAQLDDVIRKQLGQAEKSVARRTAVTSGKPPGTETLERGEHSTGLFRKIGDDGVSRLEEIDPTEVKAEGEVIGADTGLHRMLSKLDPDRRTEPGGPPTGAVPKSEPLLADKPRSPTTLTGGGRRWLGYVLGLIAVAAVAVGAIFIMTRDHGEHVVAPPPSDAPVVPEQFGVLKIDPIPEGAMVQIIGGDGVVHGFGPTSHARVEPYKVSANAKLHIHLELPGYKPFDDDRTVQPNETMVIAPRLEKAHATLHVVTTPPGAQISVDKKGLGTTPLVRDDLDAATGADLAITLPGYDPVHKAVDLALGKTTEVDETLKPAPRYGLVDLSVTNSWGDVYFKNTKIGTTPVTHALRLRLPIGTQTLHLVNTGHKPPIEWNVTCQVGDNEVNKCATRRPG